MTALAHLGRCGNYFLSLLYTGLVFLCLGPLIGAVVAAIAITIPVTGARSFSPMPFLFLPGGIFLSYAMAWKAALVTGIGVSVTASVMRGPMQLVACSAVIGALASVLLSAPANPALVYYLAGAGGVAAMVCTMIARAFRLMPGYDN